MNNETKTTAEFLDGAMFGTTETIDADDASIEMYDPEEEVQDPISTYTLYIDLPAGVRLAMVCTTEDTSGYPDDESKPMDMIKLWEEHAEELFNNIQALTAMARDMRAERDVDKRRELADQIIDSVKRSFDELRMPKFDMSGFWHETKVEEATLYFENYVKFISDVLHAAQIDVITKPTEGMSVNDLIGKMSDQMANFSFSGNQ